VKTASYTETLPRLLYFSDVPVASTFHGSALVHRLLEDHPPERLLVMETKPLRAAPERRLRGVRYREFPMSGNRWRYTRAQRWAGSWMLLQVARHARNLSRSLEGFAPEAVLTVASEYSWLVAARFAETANLPLHLILHDDWPPSMPVLRGLRARQELLFGGVYRRARSRLCVSPFMEQEYREKYGVAGQVLYPSWAKNTSSFDRTVRAYDDHRGPLVGAYAGNIFRGGYARQIAGLAERLAARGGHLLLFGPQSPQRLQFWGLDRKNVLPQGLVSSQELISRLRAEADFVLVPMSFESGDDERNMRISFPSKLTDYTAAGLPILIWGPDYCSAARWARRYAPVAEIVTSQAVEDVEAALRRLEQAQHRERLGRAAREVGDKLFSHRAAMEIFQGALLRGGETENNERSYREA